MESLVVMRGLDPRIHLSKKIDCRVKPGHDERRTVSSKHETR
jgi:hypothetical protein